MHPAARKSTIGLPVDSVTMEESLALCLNLIQERGHQHVVVNAAKIVMAHEDPKLRAIIASCPLINADGQSVVWASRFLRFPLPERVAGIDLMNRLVDVSVKEQLRIYLLGARQEVVEAVARNFSDRGANIVGYRNGYWNANEEAEIVAEIASHRPDLLFVAFPSPRKEFFLYQWLPLLNTGLAFGVGGSFDIVAGVTKRAPIFMQRIGLEWAYRLLQEPRRMFKRYLVGNTKFILLVMRYRFQQIKSRSNI